MLAIEVYVNGNHICSVELTALNTRHVDLSWLGCEGSQEVIFLGIGGMDGDEHVKWATPQIQIGDVIVLRIAKVSRVDSPCARTGIDGADQWAKSITPK